MPSSPKCVIGDLVGVFGTGSRIRDLRDDGVVDLRDDGVVDLRDYCKSRHPRSVLSGIWLVFSAQDPA